jgi:PAS domain S-box-containing protein
VVATPNHTVSFIRQLELLDAQPTRAVRQGQLQLLDAERTLNSFMVDGEPDEALFRATVEPALEGLRTVWEGAGKRAYGEMVGILWAQGRLSTALQLEELWNNLLESMDLQLFCGYPIDIFGAEFQSDAVDKVLRSHTHVWPTDQDGDLERAVHKAIEDFAPGAYVKRLAAEPLLGPHLVIPKAEKVILELRASEQSQDILGRARQYYQTERRFRALIENSSDAILLLNQRGEIQYASSSIARVFGYAPEELIASECLDLVHPDDRERAEEAVAAARLSPHEPIQFEARMRRSVGGWRWVEGTVTDLSADRTVGGLVCNCRDITDRKAAEQALGEGQRRLAAHERYLQTLLESVPECVKVLGRDGEVLEMNAAGLRMLEADDTDQVIGKCVYPLIDERDRAAFQRLNQGVFEGGVGGSLEFSITGFKGTHRVLETNVAPLRDEAGRVIGALSATRDITERKAVEAALRHANEGLEQFAYAAAHDLREPIRNVALFTELLSRRYGDQLDEQANEYMNITVEGARRMQGLVDDLLAFTRSLDQPDGDLPQTDGNEVVAEVLANLRTAIESSGANVVHGDLPKLPVYRPHLIQLLQNLIANALKYKSEDPPRIEISALEQRDEFVITVRDNGIGIPPEQRERIFGLFKRLHGREVAGNGMGLAICHRIISHYEGRIWVEPQTGKGSAFKFTLPRRRPNPAQERCV